MLLLFCKCGRDDGEFVAANGLLEDDVLPPLTPNDDDGDDEVMAPPPVVDVVWSNDGTFDG